MTKATYYNPDDVKSHFKRPSKAPKATRLSKKIVAGSVLILLTGRFKGRRVVFLKQLKSGLLLVTGPYKINGVPLKRINQAYVIPTSTTVKVDVNGFKNIDDAFFAKSKAKKTKSADNQFFERQTEVSPEEKQKIDNKKKQQITLDKPVVDAVKAIEHLGAYLNSRFTIRRNTKPHELKF